MNDVHSDGLDVSVLAALPIGVCLYGYDRRLVIATAAYCATLGLPPDAMRPGSSFIDGMRVLAYHGIFGPGDPEQQARAIEMGELARPQRLRRKHPDGRSLELVITPITDGRLLLSVTDQTTLVRPRVRAEASSRQLAGFVDSLPFGVGVFDSAQTLLHRNRRFAELLGLPLDLLPIGIGLDQLLRLRPDDADDFVWPKSPTLSQALRLALRAGPEPARTCLLDSDEAVELAVSQRPEGGWIVILRPLAGSDLGELAAQRRHRLTGRILETLPQGVAVYGPDRRLRLFNRAYAALAGDGGARVGEAFEASPFRPAGAPSASVDVTRPQSRQLRGPGGVGIEMQLLPLPDAGFACVVSAVRPADDRAERWTDILEAMLRSLRHGVMLWDDRGRLTAFNPRAIELLELPPERVTRGRSHSDLLSDLAASGALGTPDRTATLLQELRTRDRTRPHSYRRSNRAGRLLEVNSDPVAGGGFVVTYTDVTEYGIAEESLRRDREAAEAASTAKADFLATMSHELRTPLNSVIGYSETLVREANDESNRDRVGDFSKRAAEFATTINKAGHTLLALVNNILDVARIEAGRVDLSSDRIELPHLVAACVRQENAAARAAEITILANIPNGLPVLRGDERRMRQVLSHLIGNAVKFTEPRGSVRIDASLVPEGDLLLSIADTGIGIPEADLDRVFEPFYQVDSSLSRRAAGSGLGLYFCRALITAHGGELTLASRLGQGTTVVVRLPRARLMESGATR